MTYADKAFARLQDIASASTTTEGVTRLPWTNEHRVALKHITTWMQKAGLNVSLDAAGTLVGSSPNPDGKPWLLIGSHQDSVPSGGKFDGIMGIAIGCLAAEALQPRMAELPFGIKVLAFADEEGVRFPSALIGPRAMAGTLDPDVLDMADRDGIHMREAMAAFGIDVDQTLKIACNPATIIGYLEAHIEQGPVLERDDLPVAAVSAICGISRFDVIVRGTTGHAGTVPMVGRQDALVAAGRAIALVSDMASKTDVRATVGTILAKPGAVNAIPADVRFTLEVRSASDETREGFEKQILQEIRDICLADGCELSSTRTYTQRATACDPKLTGALEAAIRDCGLDPISIPSGATHDASAMADLCPVSMLFVRCRGGISHRPDEYASAEDIEVAVRTLAGAIIQIARDM